MSTANFAIYAELFDLFFPMVYNARMKKISAVFAALFFAAAFAGCGAPRYTGKTYTYFNAPITIQIDSRGLSKARLKEIFDGAENILAEIHALTDEKNAQSDVSKFNSLKKDESVPIDPITADVVNEALRYSELTGGYFNILTAPLTELWGFSAADYGDENYVFTPPTDAEIAAALPATDLKNIRLEGGILTKLNDDKTKIDLGGIAKGYALKKAREYLEGEGIIYGIISGGSSSLELMKYSENQSFEMGVKHPRGAADTPPLIEIETENISVSTSGDYERFYEYENIRYSHLINPYTGKPVDDGTMSVTVLGKDGALCDALSTALAAMGYEKAILFAKNHADDFSVFIVYTENGQNYIYSDLPADRFSVSDKSYTVIGGND